MAVIHTNFVSGTLSQAIGASDTTLNSAGFVALDVVTATDVAKIILDPFGEHGPPEIVYTTGHTAQAASITGCQRGQEGTTPRPHQVGTLFAHAPTAADWRELPNAIDQVVNNPGASIATATPVTIPVGQVNTEGTSSAVARADHIHQLQADVPAPSAPGAAAAEGTSTKVARSDHAHAREPWFVGTPAPIGGPTGSAGVSPTVARGDHVHPFTAASLNTRGVFGTAVRPIGMNNSQVDVITNDLAIFNRVLYRWTGSKWAPLTPSNNDVFSMSSDMQNGWTGAPGLLGPSRYRVGQEVVLTGNVAHGTFGSTLTTLPTGWRPLGIKKFLLPAAGPILPTMSFAIGCTINTSGTVVLDNVPFGSLVSNLAVSLDPIRFLTADEYN